VNATVYILGILLQAAAGVIALLQVRLAPRKLPWLLIALSSLLIVVRRATILGGSLSVGKELAPSEIITVIITLLFFLGVILMTRMFHEANANRLALEESEQRYRTIMEQAAEAVFIHDKAGRILDVNRKACRNLGYSREELLARSIEDIDPEAIRSEKHALWDKVLAGEQFTFQSSQIRKDGSAISVEVALGSVHLPSGLAVLGIVRDITARKREEDALRKSEARFRSYFDLPLHGIAITSLDKGWLEVNDRLCSIMGYSRDEILHMTWVEMTHPDDLAPDLEQFNRVLSGEIEQYTMDKRFIRKDGSIVWTSLGVGCVRAPGGSVEYIVALLVDITERKQAEQAVRDSEERFKAIANFTVDWESWFGPDGTYLWVNPAVESFTGYTAQEIMAMPDFISTVIADEDRALFSARFQEALAGSRGENNEFRYLHKNGAKRWLGVSWQPIFDANGAPLGTRASCREISERKRIQEKILKKNAEMERFSYAVSHDLKSPLVTIQTFLGHLVVDFAGGNKDKIAQDLAFITSAAKKMSALLDELLKFSKVGRVTNPSVETPLQEIAREALDLVAGRIDKRGVRVQVAQDPVVLCGDRVRLVEVFQNLVDNAVKFMSGQPEPLVEIGAETKDGESVCFVSDNGMGIDPRHRDKLFGLFEKLNPEMAGTGLGLAMVKRIVEVHGGRIWVESEGIGRGACFWFTLPGKSSA